MREALHLVKLALRPDKLVTAARGRGLPDRDIDDGYLTHVVLRELWQEGAPVPFVLRERDRALELWGYSRHDAASLVDHASAFGDPSLVQALASLDAIASRPVPVLEPGRHVSFVVRACPVVRLVAPRKHLGAGAEVDAFLAQCLATAIGTPVSREEVYTEWLRTRVSRPATTGVRVLRVGIAGLSRCRLIRRTHGQIRQARRLERPDVRFEGEMVVEDGEKLRAYLAHGVGRHRAFGFGALMLAPPGGGSRGRAEC